jgi:spore germination protein GerM
MQANLRTKIIGGIAIAGTVIIAATIAGVVFRPKPPNPTTPIQTIPVVDSSNSQLPLQNVDLFFCGTTSRALVREKRELPLSEDMTERLKQIINELLTGSTGGLRNTIPKGTELHQVYIDKQSIAYLDFSRRLSDAHIGGTTAEMLTVEAILRTVAANFPQQIKKVQILIEGQEVNTIAGHVDISKPFALTPESRPREREAPVEPEAADAKGEQGEKKGE